MKSGMARWTLAVVCVATAVACGGGSDSPTQPSPPTGGGGGTTPPAANATITVTSTGASPRNVEVAVGGTVTFVNSDSAAHEMHSDPHPVHTDCPPLNAVGVLQTGQMRASQALTTARVCGYHDHLNPGSSALQGSITVR